MTPEEAANFCEAGENPAEIFAAFDAAPHSLTTAPHPIGPLCAPWPGTDCQHNSCWDIAEGTPVLTAEGSAPGVFIWYYASGRIRATAPWDLV
jgi:hypothetical protein